MLRCKIDVPPATTLGTATVENRTPFRRRVMQVVTLPLKDSDGYRMGDPVTVANPGTGQDERAQVESWAMRYPSGNERVIRLTYPAVLAASSLRTQHSFSVSGGGADPTPALQTHVIQALAQLRFRFLCGPKETHYVEWLATDNPAVVYSGRRSVIYRWFRRVYEPPHAPTLRTQFWVEVDMELFYGEDYATVHARFGYCDPRLTDHGENRDSLSDADTEIGFYISPGSSQHWAHPVPLYQDQSVRSLAWEPGAARWKWVIDKRTQGTFGGPVNRFIPWGCMASVKAVVLFRGATGTIGDTLRDDSMRAWYQGGEIPFTHAIADTWIEKQEAYGPTGQLMPRPKRHQHWDRNRDATYVRQALENEALVFYANKSNVAGGNLWYTYSETAQVYGSIDGNSPGNHASWGSQLHAYAALAYSVPGIGHFVERNFMQHPWVWFYREVDGSVVSAANHPNMIIDRGAPGELMRGVLGDMLGKTSLQQWRSTAASFLIVAENTGSAYLAPDIAHWECSGVTSFPVIFGDRGVRRIAEHLAYTTHLGYWQPLASRRGSTGEARGFGRGGLSMASWFLWIFGSDILLAQRAAEVLYDHYFVPAREREDAQFPNRVIKTHNVYAADGGAGPNRVALRFHRYFRPWEDTTALVGAVGIARLISHLYPTQGAGFAYIARTTASDVLRYGSPRVVDETTGVVSYVATPDFVAAAAAFLDGTRHLTAAEIGSHNYQLCAYNGQNNGDCTEMLDGYMLLRSTSGVFTHALAWWVLSDAIGSQDLILHRYVRDEVKVWDYSRPNTNRHMQWLIEQGRHGAIGYQDRLALGTATSRGTFGVTPSDISISIDTADSLWLTGPATGQLRRMLRSNGSITATIDPPGTGPTAGWTGVACYRDGGQAMLALLDGNDPSLNRATYKVTVMREATPTVLHQTTTFTYPGGTKRDGRAIAWDPSVGAWLVLARDALSVQTLWLVYPGSTVAVQYTGALIDLAGVESIAIDRDGKLLAMCDAASTIHVYGRGDGGIWGVPRSITTTITSARYCAFTDHARTDDAQRLVTTSVGTPVKETEI